MSGDSDERFKAGNEDVYVSLQPLKGGFVRFSVYALRNDVKLMSFVLTGEGARSTAEKLTLASWQAEGDGSGGS